MADSKAPIVGVIMGSKSDWEYMAAAAEVMEELQVPHEVRIMSAHRTPDITLEYSASAAGRGLRGASCGGGRSEDDSAGDWRADADDVAQRDGFAAVDSADAERRAGRDDGDWQSGCGECGAAGGADNCAERREAGRAAREMAGGEGGGIVAAEVAVT